MQIDKSIGIMQPYFFPYLGYFQLISAVECYVNLDHVSFMKRSYMTRNSLKNNITFGLQVNKGSQNNCCDNTIVNFDNRHVKKTLKTIEQLYSKSTNYDKIMTHIVLPTFEERQVTVSEFNMSTIKIVCEYFGIKTSIVESSRQFDVGLKSAEMLIDITKKLSGRTYINAIGGQKIYEKNVFEDKGISLRFLKMGEVQLEDPYKSILHQLFNYDTDHLIGQLSNFSLV